MSAEYLKLLKEKRQTLWARAQELPSTAAAEKREMTAEENQNFGQFNKDLDDIDQRITEHETNAKRALAADAIRSENTATIPRTTDQRTVRDESDTFRNLAAIVYDKAQGSRFHDFRYSQQYRENMEQRALAIGADGPNTVSVNFADFVAVYQRTMNPTYATSTVITSGSGNNLTIPRLTADLTQYSVNGGTAITESTPTISSVTLTVTGYKALSYVGQELAQDEEVGLTGLIARSAARSIAIAAGTDFTTGTNGFISLGTNGGTASGTAYGTATEAFFAAPDLITLFYGLAAPYRMNSVWHLSNTALQKVRKFVTSTGEFIWSPGLDGAQSDRLLGRPVYENPALAAAASASKSVAVGDFSAYTIKEVVPIRVEASSEFLFNLDQVAYKTVWRAGGTLPDAAAIRYLVSANS